MTTETVHPLLTGIHEAVTATGSHSLHWGQLRREAFPGVEESWVGLKAWCAANAIDCELAYSHSSKGTQVQFRKAKKV